MMATSIERNKQLLVACDQSYFTSVEQVLNKSLQDLPDKSADAPAEYGDSRIYAPGPQFSITPGYIVEAVIDRSTQIGAKALIYRNASTNELIVAFGGTDGINSQDWKSNTQNVGWDQWMALKKPIFDELARISNSDSVKAAGGLKGIHFTGQSLGGALAQYAAYEYVKKQITPTEENPTPTFDKSKVTLTTFNGLGAIWGLKANGGYDAKVLTGLGQAAHYVVDNDLVSRLGGGHIGSKDEVIKFDWTYLADAANDVKAGKPMDIADAHRIETAFYTHIVTGNEFADGKVVKEKSSDFPLIDVPGAVKWAGYLGNLFNNETVTPAEGLFRLIAGLVGGTVAADANEIDAVVQAAIDAKHRSEKMGEFKYSILKNINFGYVGKMAFFNKIGLSLYLGSVLGSVAIDFVSGSVELLKKASSWISSLFGKDLDIPAVQASTENENLLRLQAALAAEPDAWKDAENKKKAQYLKDKLGGVTLTDEMAKAAVTGGDHWPQACALALAEGILANPAAQSLTPSERASLVAQAESNYWSFLTAGARQEPALLAKVVADMEAFWPSAIGNAVAKLNPDYLKAGGSALALAGLDGYSSRKSFTDALLDGIKSAANLVFSALSGTAYAEEAKSGFEQTATNIRNASEMIVLRAGSGANPFNSESFDPDAEPVSAGNLREGGGQSFSMYIPYAAGKDGQKIKLNLAGGAAYAFDVYINGLKLPGNATEFELTIEAGKREATFALFALRDVDADETLGLTAQLVDSSGQPTHQSHLELNLAFDATEENETNIQYVRSKILEDTMPENDPAGESFSGSEDRFATWSIVGTNNNDVIYGAEAGDWLQGEAGNDLIYGEGGKDEIRGGDGDDLLAGGHGRSLNPDDLPDDADLLIGGDSLDRLYGMEGDDRLYGGDVVETAAAIEQAGQFAETTLAEFLEGGEGDDLLVGGTSNYLFGGAGADLIVGGGGNDIAQGDTFDSGYSTGLDKITWRLEYNEAKRKSYVYLERVENGETELYSRFGYEDADGKGDTIITGAGNDIALGESGDDFLMLGDGADIGIGGEGNDTIEGGDGADRIMGDFNWDASAPDGTESEAELMNYAGLEGQYHGNDTLHGGAGDDSIEGNGGDDFIDGGEGRDSIHGDDGITPGNLHGKDIVDGGEGDDSLFGDGNDDELYGGAGEDELSGDSDWLDGQYHGNDYLDGGEGADKLWGNGGDDELFGGDGDDYLEGDYADLDGQSHGADYLDGEDGNDVLIGEGGSDQLFGGSGADTLLGDDSPEALLAAEFHGDDYLDGEAGDDTLIGGGGNDQLMGGEGNDKLYGDGDTAATGGDDYLDGEAGDDLLSGDGGNDILMGGDGDDGLLGGDGNDQLIGGAGADYLAGGAGNDTYLFAAGDSPTNGAGQNEVVDDLSGNNTVRFESAYLGGIKVTADASGGYLVIDYTEGDRLLVKNGMAGSVAAYEFADGERVSYSELIGRMSDAILYSTGPDGTEYAMGGFDNDTMQATHGSTVISGGRGDDTIMGSGGNNTYLYSHGDGSDVIRNRAIPTQVDTLRFGEQIGKGDVSLLRRLNGDLLLSLNDGSGSVVLQGWYAKPENRIARITFADGSAFTSEELFAVPLVGTADGDVMAGSEYTDTIEGLAGNDVLDGGAGNDTLIGGEGLDTYILKYGMGKDTVVDASDGGNAIKLVSGLDFSDLDAERSGNDLFVHIHGNDQGMMLQGYYTNPQSWVVQNDAGEQQDVAGIVEATNAAAQQGTVNAMWRDYLAQVRNSFTSTYLSQGYLAAADGSLHWSWSMGDGANVSANVTDLATTIQTTYQYFDGPTYTVTYTYPDYDWHTSIPYLYEASAVLNELATVSDEQEIYSQAGETSSSASQWVIAKVAWQPAVSWHNQSSWTDSWIGYIYGGTYGSDVVGITRNARENYSYEGYAYGAVTGFVTDRSVAISAGDHPEYVLANLGNYTYTTNIEEITAGASDNKIYGNSYTLVDAGDGNDTVSGAGLAYGGAGDDILSDGNILIGGTGDDALSNGQVLIGGEGSDTMDGAGYGTGETRYLIDPTQVGIDLICDTGDSLEAYKQWYYNAQGIQDWQMREGLDGYYTSRSASSDTGYFTYQDLTDPNNWFAEWFVNHPEDLLEPLPPMPMPAANDYAALQSAYDENAIPMNTVEFTDGISLADISLSWGRESGRVTLDLSWNNGLSQVRLVVPNADDTLGFGIERVKFADGSELGMGELIALAPPMDLYLEGTEDADTLTSLAGNTTFYGGQGSDILTASGGGNTYVYNTGDGTDIIIDTSKADGADSPNALVFGPAITPDQVTLSLGSLMLRIGDNPEDVIHIEGFDPDRPFDLPAIDEFRFADGTVLGYADLLQKGFDLQGDDSDNVITGTALVDRISCGAGQDRLAGGAGDDVLSGGTGRDAYVFNLGDGNDVLQDDMDPAEGSLLVFGEGISRDSLRFEQETGGLRIRYGDSDSVLLADYDPAGNPVAVQVEFADGSTATLDDLMNTAPVAAEELVDQVAMEDTAFAFSVPEAAFSDANTGDALTWMATSGNGSVLPAWLSFDPVTRSFSGTPGNSDVGQFSVRVIATDRWGKSAEQVFNLAVANVNDAPVATAAIDEQLAQEDALFAFRLPADDFSDVDAGDALTCRATLDDGSPLPAWLSFDPATLAFSGTPTNGDVGSMRVVVTATDMADASASEVFILNVANVNDAPVLMQAMDNPITQEDAPFTLALPADLFADMDAGDGLSYSAALADGSVLPAWLVFDEASRTFSGTPGNDDVGTLDIRVTAMDMAGASASTAFALAVQNVNDAPVLLAPWGNRAAVEDAAFTFTVPDDAFADVDQGDVLAYSATLSDGSALPAWLSFDPATRTFSGEPANGDVGSLSVTVTATDLAGASAISTFAMEIANVNDAPTAAALADQATLEDAPFSFTLPPDAFADEDSIHGDSLSYGATLADGSALPAWLSFDAATRTFSGTPANADVGIVRVAVSATDSGGLAAASRFDIEVRNVNDAPVLAIPLADQTARSGDGFLFQLPGGSFTDADQGDTLSYSAKLADGSTLPSWLKFDSATQTFSGQVPNSAKGSLDIQVVASDGHGAESIASDVFRVSFTKDECGGHGNEGVGNGQDAPPPGHGDNWNDGPGTSPGHPGSKGGKGRSHDDDHDESSGWNDHNKLFSAPYLDLKKLDRHYDEFAGRRTEADTSATVARWIEVDLAVSRQRALEDKSLPWLREGNGADIAVLRHASAGFLGSKTGCGVDDFSLAAGAGTQLKAFHGLQEGMRKIA